MIQVIEIIQATNAEHIANAELCIFFLGPPCNKTFINPAINKKFVKNVVICLILSLTNR